MHADAAMDVAGNSPTMAGRCQPYVAASPVSPSYNLQIPVIEKTRRLTRRYKKAARTVASSFENFLENLEPNPDANW